MFFRDVSPHRLVVTDVSVPFGPRLQGRRPTTNLRCVTSQKNGGLKLDTSRILKLYLSFESVSPCTGSCPVLRPYVPCIPDSCLACPLLVPAVLPACLEAYDQKYPVFIGFPSLAMWKQTKENDLRGMGVNHLTPNGHYMGRTAQLTSRRYILYIYSTNIRTEYFKYAA